MKEMAPHLSDDRGNGSLSGKVVGTAEIIAAGAGLYYGGGWALDNIHTFSAVQDLSYLGAGLRTPQTPEWWKVAGVSSGTQKATLRHSLLNQVKRFEETLGGIPRTFGLFGPASSTVFSTPEANLHITPEALEGAEDYYGRLLKTEGEMLTAEDRLRGFKVAPHKGGSALFRLSAEGDIVGKPLLEGVGIRVRRWAVEGKGLTKVGANGQAQTLHQMVTLDSELLAESVGAKPIARSNPFPFIVTASPKTIELGGLSRGVAEEMIDPSRVTSFIGEYTSPRTRSAIREAGMFTKAQAIRYMKVLDAPLEFAEEITSGLRGGEESALLSRARKSRGYGYFKNVFGTGGNYSGSAIDILARHGGRIAGIGVALAATYQGISAITSAVFDRNVAQIGGEVIGAAQRLTAKASDLSGLTALNKAQEKEAEGSGSLMAVAAFPLSGFITGHLAAAAKVRVDNFALGGGIASWKAAREVTHEAPQILKVMDEVPLLGKLVKGKKTLGGKWGLAGAAIGMALSLPFLPGALGSSKSYDEVRGEQAGEIEVAVKKGAHWESGRVPWEGDKTQYFRPGWYRRLMDDSSGESQFGEYNDKPFTRLIKGLTDPYFLEKQHYYDRPYPITGADSSIAGPLGPIWGMTIGRIFKPTAYMHLDELSAGGTKREAVEGRVFVPGLKDVDLPREDLGGMGLRAATDPHSTMALGNDLLGKVKDAVGLTGFAVESIYKKLTGDRSGFDSMDPRLASASDMGSLTNRFWNMGLGGGGGTTEAIRRFLPKKPFARQEINPIRNEMPDWLPGAGSFINFQTGDSYSKIQEGELRLPGVGYARRFKELEGVDPADYKAVHRLRILGDVAPYSKELTSTLKEVKQLSAAGSLSSSEEQMYQATVAQINAKEERIHFAKGDDGLIGGYWGLLKKLGRMNPAEHILPISPVHKFAGPVSAAETYRDREIFSSANPDWSSPLREFIEPAIRSGARLVGVDPMPAKVERHREMEEYLDKVSWLKSRKMAKAAGIRGDKGAAYRHERSADFTMFGMDPYSDLTTIEKVLPGSERPYFRSFVAEDDADKRSEILSMVPRYTRKFYLAQWQKKEYTRLASKGELTSDEATTVKHIEAARALEGRAATMSDWKLYQQQVEDQKVKANNFANFVKSKEASRYFAREAPMQAPPEDWVGYDERIVMPDIKTKVLQQEGFDFHDFGIWDDRAQSVARKPYVTEAASQLLRRNGEDQESIYRSLTNLGFEDVSVQVVNAGARDSITFDMSEDQRHRIDRQLEENGYRRGL